MPDWLLPNFMQLPAFLLDNLAWIALGAAILGALAVWGALRRAVGRRRR